MSSSPLFSLRDGEFLVFDLGVSSQLRESIIRDWKAKLYDENKSTQNALTNDPRDKISSVTFLSFGQPYPELSPRREAGTRREELLHILACSKEPSAAAP